MPVNKGGYGFRSPERIQLEYKERTQRERADKGNPPAHGEGTRNLLTGARSLTPSGGLGRRVTMTILTKIGKTALVVNRPFRGVPVLINCETRYDIPRGAVLVRNETLGRRKGTEAVWIIYAKGLFEAMRGQIHHSAKGYRDEIATLNIALAELPVALQLSWALPGNDAAAFAAYRNQVSKVATAFALSRDPLKCQAYDQLAAAFTAFDRLGRFNPPAMSARIGAAKCRVHDRVELARVVDHRMDARRMALSIIMDRLWAMVQDLYSEVVRDRMRFEKIIGDPLGRSRMSSRLSHMAGRFALVDIAPYGTHAFPHVVADLREASSACLHNRAPTFRAAMSRVERSIKLLQVHRHVEDALVVASLAEKDDGRWSYTDADCASACALLREMVAFLETNPGLDRGFKKKIQTDAQNALKRALLNVQCGKIRYLYEDLRAAAKCF